MCGPVFRTKYENALTPQERDHCLEIFLKEKFPTKIYAFILIYTILLGLCMIGFQIALIVVKGSWYYIGTGIWIGSILVIVEIVGLGLSNYYFNFTLVNIKISANAYVVKVFKRERRYYGINSLVRLLGTLVAIPQPIIMQLSIRAVNLAVEKSGCKSCFGFPYLWINWTLFGLAIANIPGHIFLNILFRILKAKTCREFHEKKKVGQLKENITSF